MQVWECKILTQWVWRQGCQISEARRSWGTQVQFVDLFVCLVVLQLLQGVYKLAPVIDSWLRKLLQDQITSRINYKLPISFENSFCNLFYDISSSVYTASNGGITDEKLIAKDAEISVDALLLILSKHAPRGTDKNIKILSLKSIAPAERGPNCAPPKYKSRALLLLFPVRVLFSLNCKWVSTQLQW
jgi:hypothetical protein